MGSPGESSQRIAFGEFVLDLRTREVWLDGTKFDLQEQPFQVLSSLLERPGELVTREELTKRLWSSETFVDYEHALNRVIKRLREALSDSAEQPRFIETLPRRGYRFIAPVRPVSLSDQPAESTDRAHSETVTPRPWYRRLLFIAVAAAIGSVAGWITYQLLSPAPTLRVIRSRQLTASAKIDPWGGIISDGSRLYFLEREGDHWNLAQTSVSGGDSQIVPAPFRNTRILDISPNRSSFLIGSFISRDTLMPLWIWPVQGSAPRRVGDVSAFDAAWCPDGQHILYSQTDGIYQIGIDGIGQRKFLNMTGGRAGFFSWSPDGRFLRFTFMTVLPWSGTIMQVDADGSHLRPVPTGWTGLPDDCCGRWSGDGKYYFFRSGRNKILEIFALREQTSWLRPRPSEPVRLTAGPLSFGFYWLTSDARTLFALAANGRSELVRYDLRSHQFTPFLSDLSIFSLSFSPDGQSLVYRRARDFSLARIKPDGSQLLTLTGAQDRGTSPVWSPDGRQIAFADAEPGQPVAIFLMPSDGGTPKRLVAGTENRDEPSWSPDGKLIAFTSEDPANPGLDSGSIKVFDLATGQTSLLPGSIGLRTPSWSPDGQRIAAFTGDIHKLMELDRKTGQWTQLATGANLSGPPVWSKDGEYLYYQDLLAPNQPIFRIRLRDRKIELVTSLESFLHSGTHRAGFLGLAPDGSIIIRLDRGDNDVYALDLDTP